MTFFKIVILLICLIDLTYGLTLNELKSMPKSIERDFFIWRFLNEVNTSKKEAKEAIKLRYRLNAKLKNSFYKKTGIKLKTKNRYTPNKETLKKYQKIIYNLHKSNNFYEAWLKLDTIDKIKVFNLGGRNNRKLLNKNIPSNILIQMSNYYSFNEFLYRVKKDKLNQIYSAIINTNFQRDNKIKYKNLITIGFETLKNNNLKRANNFFRLAFFKAKNKFEQDRVLFWLYMSSKNKIYLDKLSKSYEINIYKLLALDFLAKPYPTPDKIKILNNKKIDINLSNPIQWARIKKKIFSKKYNLYNLAKEFESNKTISLYSYILTKASRHKKQYFPIVYKNLIQNYSIHRQALILALAKQESQFIPSAISKSFALGLMQFMPFLVKDISKKNKLNIKLEDMFEPKTAIKFANIHLNYLEKYLHHPLLVAYAYNGGIGFTRKLVRNKKYFQNREYEPYLSMELIPNQESNYYAKRVIANYIIYRKLLNSPVKATDILNQLINHKMHNF